MNESGIEKETPGELKPVPLVFLEIGTDNGGNFVRNGLLPHMLPEGVTVLTVDFPRKHTYPFEDNAEPSDPYWLKNSYTEAAENAKRAGLEVPKFSHEALIADARKLPLGDETVDRVVLNDVIGDPAVKEVSMKKLINEALRVLKIGGEIWIFDARAIPPNLKILAKILGKGDLMGGGGYTYDKISDIFYGSTRGSTDFLEREKVYKEKLKYVNSNNPSFTIVTKTAEWKPLVSAEVPEQPTVEPPAPESLSLAGIWKRLRRPSSKK